MWKFESVLYSSFDESLLCDKCLLEQLVVNVSEQRTVKLYCWKTTLEMYIFNVNMFPYCIAASQTFIQISSAIFVLKSLYLCAQCVNGFIFQGLRW